MLDGYKKLKKLVDTDFLAYARTFAYAKGI